MQSPILLIIVSLSTIARVNSLQCYQCDSAEDEFCPAFGFFDETKNALVDCYGLESATPGHMCVKISKSSPDTLYGKKKFLQTNFTNFHFLKYKTHFQQIE
jgi:hypothetical protein